MNMLDRFVGPIVPRWDNCEKLHFVHDGAPPHFALYVRAWPDDCFPALRIVRRGPREWSHCDFILCDWAKRQVHRTEPRALDKLQQGIRDTCVAPPCDFLRKIFGSVSRLQKVVPNAQAHCKV